VHHPGHGRSLRSAACCAEAGVLGVLPGIVGLLQANEAIKLLLGLGDPLVGRLFYFDGLRSSFTELALDRNPANSAEINAAPVRRRST